MDRPRETGTWLRRHATKVASAGVVTFLLVGAGFSASTRRAVRVDLDSVRLAEVKLEPFRERVTATGSVRPRHLVFLESLDGGRIESVDRREGSELEPGDAILRLSNPDLDLEAQRLEEQLSQALDRLRNTRLLIDQSRRDSERRLLEIDHQILVKSKDLQIQEELFAEKLAPRRDLDKARDEHLFWLAKKDLFVEGEERDQVFRQTQVEQANEAVARRRRNLETARAKLDRLVVRSPIRGRLTALDAELGKTVAPGERLGQIDAGGFEIQGEVDQAYAGRIAVGQEAELDHFDSKSRRSFPLQVTKVYEEIRGGKLTLDLDFESEPPADLKRGQRVTLRIALGALEEATVVPIGPFHQTTAGRWIFVLEGEGRATRREIRTGRRNEQAYEVVEGLEAGERVIVSRYDSFGEAQRLILED